MKKETIILIIFILIAASAAADVNLGGSFEIMANLSRGDTWSGNDPKTAMERDMLISIGAKIDYDKFGVKGALVRNTNFWVYAWWKPIEVFMIKMGSIYEESTWAAAYIAGEGLHDNKFSVRQTEDFAGNVLKSETGFFYPVMTDLQMERALQLSFYPFESLAINLGFPMDRSAFNNMAEYNYIYKLHAQAVYAIDGIGEAAVSFINAPNNAAEFKNIFVQWKMPIGSFLKLELGFNLGFNQELIEPLKIGLGFGWGNLSSDRLVVNVRAGASIPMEDKQDTNMGIDIVPSYDFYLFRLYVPVGIGVNQPVNNEAVVYWSFNPYVAKNLGGPFFYAGFQLYKSTVGDGIEWAIPLGFRWDF